MSDTRSLETIARDELFSNTCVCGAHKKDGNSFCTRCYYQLPAQMRLALYTPMSRGYASIYDEAKDWLRTYTERLKRKQNG